ncbi:MAG: M20/M25/M40 family metallo-hydrolase [Acidobacteriota bacterium]
MFSRPSFQYFILFAALLSPSLAKAVDEEEIQWEAISLIRHEGFNNSQLEEILRHLTDHIGPRLTGSPALLEANNYTRDKLEEWGLENAALEEWGPFGRGWSFSRTAVHLLEPRPAPLSALPKAWTPGTDGPVRGEVLRVDLDSDADLDRWRGKLEGKILFLSESKNVSDPDGVEFRRYSDAELSERMIFAPPRARARSGFRDRFRRRWEFGRKLNRFLENEGVLATVDVSSRDAGILRVGAGGSREPGESPGVSSLIMAAEHYNWVSRLLARGETVEMEVDVAAQFHDEDTMAYNTIAEIPGTDKADELVMVGAHLDSWHPSPGSNDNAAGVVVAMEAVRILKTLGLEPRRTIRIGLWTGEEQGLLGARAYVAKHFAARPEPDDQEILKQPSFLWPETWPIDYKPAHGKFQAYFNLDNGSGRIRGIYTQSNAALQPIFEQWLKPFHDLEAKTVTNRNTGGTDHQAFDAYSLPGFQFIQDPLDYSSRTHHTHLDHFDHARIEDLKQASIVMAGFIYQAAMREELLPRKPKPAEPSH